MFDEFEHLEDLELIESEHEKEVRKIDRIQDAEELFNSFTDVEFQRHFRLTKSTCKYVIDTISTGKTLSGPYHIEALDILCLLNYLATGSFMFVTARILNISLSGAHRAIHRAMRAVSSKFDQFVGFPLNLERVKTKFRSKYGLRNVIGAIDGTHIPMQKVRSDDPETFMNRKGFFSINVQAVCRPDNMFFDAVIRWPGSTHDSRIFESSSVYTRLQMNELDGILLGDSGYPLKPWCITPLRNPVSHAEKSNFDLNAYLFFI